MIISDAYWGDSSQTEQNQETSPQSYSEAGMEAFRSDNWNKMDDDEKLESMQQLSDEYSAQIGLSNPPTVVPETNANNYGGYVESTNEVKVNLDNCSNPYEAVDTVIHEDTHAYQAEAINSELLSESRYSEADLAVLKSQNYSAYANSGMGYDTQALELDANSTAFQYVSANCSGMNDDPAYFEYITNRDAHFQDVNSNLNNKTKEVNALETEQANTAFTNLETTEEEWNLATKTIQEGNTTFRGASNEAGAEALQGSIDCSVTRASQLHNDFVESNDKGTAIKTEDYQKCIGYMQEGLAQSQEELKSLRAEQSEYISSNNMGFRAVAADEKCQEYQAKIEACEHDIGQFNYHITELSTDLELSQQGGLSQGSEGLASGLGESAGSEMDNGLSM